MPVASGLYYFAHEAENYSRPPAILIHGAGGNHLYWPPQIRRLHNQRVFAVDLPGHGKSGGVGHHTVQDYAEEILGLIKRLKLSAAVLIGHSLGSAVALQAAIHAPKRVIGLGLVGSGARLRVAPAILQSASDPSLFADAVRMLIDASFAQQTNARLKEPAAQRMSEVRPAVLYGDLLACDAFNVMDQLARISVPALVLCGADDKMTPLKYSEFLRDAIPKARLEVLPGAGHMVMLERPDEVAGILSDFLDAIPYQPGQ